MGLIIKGPPSQGFSHHFPYEVSFGMITPQKTKKSLTGMAEPWMSRCISYIKWGDFPATLRLPTPPMETPDPPSDTPGASKQVGVLG